MGAVLSRGVCIRRAFAHISVLAPHVNTVVTTADSSKRPMGLLPCIASCKGCNSVPQSQAYPILAGLMSLHYAAEFASFPHHPLSIDAVIAVAGDLTIFTGVF